MMSEKQREILETFNQFIPHLTELDQEKLLAFGEGMAFMVNRQAERPVAVRPST